MARVRSRPLTPSFLFRHLKYLLVLPTIVVLAPLSLYPFLIALWYSFHGVSVYNFWNPPFVGIDNFAKALLSPDTRVAIFNTFLYVAVVVSLEFLIGLGLALLFSQRFPARGLLAVLTITPIALAPAVVGYIFLLLLYDLYGLIPAILRNLGLSLSLLGSKELVFPVMMAIDVWEWTPFMFLILYAGMKALPPEPLEAAQVDGAGRWTVLTRVIIPLMGPTITVALVFRFVDAFRTFDFIYVMTGGGPGTTSTTISILVYRAFSAGSIGLSAAESVLVLILAAILARLFIRYLYGRWWTT